MHHDEHSWELHELEARIVGPSYRLQASVLLGKNRVVSPVTAPALGPGNGPNGE